MEIIPVTIKEHINTDYRTYALYVIQSRGIPNFYDSLTPVQRLILQQAPDKLQTTVSLVGAVMATGLYHHGDMSLTKAINKLAKPFGCSRVMLQGDGFFGTPVNPKPASSRYTKVRTDKVTDAIVEKYQPLNKKNQEGNYDFLYVDLPVALCSHIIGIAVGYRSNILPRKMEEVEAYLDGVDKPLKPHFSGFGGKVKKFNGVDNAWLIEGEFEADDSKMEIRIGDLPPMQKYTAFLSKLYEKLALHGDHCKVTNDSKKTVSITIKWTDRDSYAGVKAAVEKLTKLAVIEQIIFVKDGAVIEYSSIHDYLDEFRVHRERVFHLKMTYDLQVFSSELDFLRAKREFLLFMMEKKRKNEEIKEFIGKYNPSIRSRLDAIKLTALSPETVKQVETQIKELEQQIQDQKKMAEAQLKKCKALEKTFVSKGKAHLGQSSGLFEETDIYTLGGVELFHGEEDEEDVIDEFDDDENQ